MTLKFEQSQFVWLTLITMTWSGCLEDVIAGDHVVHHAALGDLLGPDDLWRREVHAIIVQRLVWFVAGNWGGLQSHKQKKKSLSALLKHPTCGTTMQSVMVSLSPATTLVYLSVFTVHNTTTSSTLFFSLNSLVHRNVHEREKEGEFLSLSTWWCPWSAP